MSQEPFENIAAAAVFGMLLCVGWGLLQMRFERVRSRR